MNKKDFYGLLKAFFVSIVIIGAFALIILTSGEEKPEQSTQEQRYIDAMELYLSDFEPTEIRLFKRLGNTTYMISADGKLYPYAKYVEIKTDNTETK